MKSVPPLSCRESPELLTEIHAIWRGVKIGSFQ